MGCSASAVAPFSRSTDVKPLTDLSITGGGGGGESLNQGLRAPRISTSMRSDHSDASGAGTGTGTGTATGTAGTPANGSSGAELIQLLSDEYHISVKSLTQLQKLFDESDTNSDKLLDEAEFLGLTGETAGGRTSIGGGGTTSKPKYAHNPFVSFLFKSVDPACVRVSFSQFVSMLSRVCVMTELEMLQFAFGICDTDSSGFIEKAELLTLASSAETDADRKKIMTEMDGDGDGRISFNEFVEMNTRFPHFLWPLFRLQSRLKRGMLGEEFWATYRDKLVEDCKVQKTQQQDKDDSNIYDTDGVSMFNQFTRNLMKSSDVADAGAGDVEGAGGSTAGRATGGGGGGRSSGGRSGGSSGSGDNVIGDGLPPLILRPKSTIGGSPSSPAATASTLASGNASGGSNGGVGVGTASSGRPRTPGILSSNPTKMFSKKVRRSSSVMPGGQRDPLVRGSGEYSRSPSPTIVGRTSDDDDDRPSSSGSRRGSPIKRNSDSSPTTLERQGSRLTLGYRHLLDINAGNDSIVLPRSVSPVAGASSPSVSRRPSTSPVASQQQQHVGLGGGGDTSPPQNNRSRSNSISLKSKFMLNFQQQQQSTATLPSPPESLSPSRQKSPQPPQVSSSSSSNTPGRSIATSPTPSSTRVSSFNFNQNNSSTPSGTGSPAPSRSRHLSGSGSAGLGLVLSPPPSNNNTGPVSPSCRSRSSSPPPPASRETSLSRKQPIVAYTGSSQSSSRRGSGSDGDVGSRSGLDGTTPSGSLSNPRSSLSVAIPRDNTSPAGGGAERRTASPAGSSMPSLSLSPKPGVGTGSRSPSGTAGAAASTSSRAVSPDLASFALAEGDAFLSSSSPQQLSRHRRASTSSPSSAAAAAVSSSSRHHRADSTDSGRRGSLPGGTPGSASAPTSRSTSTSPTNHRKHYNGSSPAMRRSSSFSRRDASGAASGDHCIPVSAAMLHPLPTIVASPTYTPAQLAIAPAGSGSGSNDGLDDADDDLNNDQENHT